MGWGMRLRIGRGGVGGSLGDGGKLFFLDI